jgi:hypothetical protein
LIGLSSFRGHYFVYVYRLSFVEWSVLFQRLYSIISLLFYLIGQEAREESLRKSGFHVSELKSSITPLALGNNAVSQSADLEVEKDVVGEAKADEVEASHSDTTALFETSLVEQTSEYYDVANQLGVSPGEDKGDEPEDPPTTESVAPSSSTDGEGQPNGTGGSPVTTVDS